MRTHVVPSRKLLRTAALVTAALALAGCSGNSTGSPSTAGTAKPTASLGRPLTSAEAAPHQVTFQVTGNGYANVTWIGGSAKHVRLPWRQAANSPLGADGLTLTVQLDQGGGSATCAIAVDGRRVASSLAQGAYGHATCHTGGSAQADD